MTIDWNAFTPLSALAGGVPIGVAAIGLERLRAAGRDAGTVAGPADRRTVDAGRRIGDG